MKLYMIRHGESETNLRSVYAGQTDAKLTEKGLRNALEAKERLKNISFDKVYSSDLSRAMDTQKIALPGITAETTPLLREIHVGSIAGKKSSECLEEYGEKFLADRKHYNFVPYGGENSEMLRARVCEFLGIIEKSQYSTIAAFCHGGVIKTALETIIGAEIDKYVFECFNCSVSVFEFSGNRWRVLHWNYCGELL